MTGEKLTFRSADTVITLVVLSVFAVGALAGLASSSRAHPPAFPTSQRIEVAALAPETLEAQAAIVYDPSNGAILYEKNAESQFPLASLTKLMTADVALASIPATSTVTITARSLRTDGDSKLKLGQRWNVSELIKYSLVVSSNDGMAAVAESIGGQELMNRMNAEAETLGLAQSYFLDPTGLDLTNGTSGAYGSAKDVATLAAAFYKKYPAYFESTLRSGATFGDAGAEAAGKATAEPILDIPGLIGAKTGYTDLAGGNLVVIFDQDLGHPLVAVVLHSSQQGRFKDVRALIEAARSAQVH